MKPGRTALYAWAIEPSAQNVGGASDRPVPADIWTIIQLKLSESPDEQEIQRAYNRVRRRGLASVCSIL